MCQAISRTIEPSLLAKMTNSSIVDSAGRSTETSIRGSSTYVGREGVSSYNDTNSATTSNFGSIKNIRFGND